MGWGRSYFLILVKICHSFLILFLKQSKIEGQLFDAMRTTVSSLLKSESPWPTMLTRDGWIPLLMSARLTCDARSWQFQIVFCIAHFASITLQFNGRALVPSSKMRPSGVSGQERIWINFRRSCQQLYVKFFLMTKYEPQLSLSHFAPIWVSIHRSRALITFPSLSSIS